MKPITDLTVDEERAAAVFRALGNPARLRIVRELARRRVCVTGALVDLLPLAQSTVSQHLKVLKEAGVVRGKVEGELCYCLDPETVGWLAAFAIDLCCPEDLTPVKTPPSRADREPIGASDGPEVMRGG